MCCESVPQPQLGDPTVFLSSREVLELVKQWRVGHARRPLADSMCFANDIVNKGGRQCRREGEEICHGENNPCLLYKITAPYYKANIPFLINNQKIKKKIEKLLEEDRKLDRHKNKNTAAEVEKRPAFGDLLDKTFSIVREDIKDLIRSGPVR